MFFSIKMLKLPLSKCQDFLLQQISMVGHFSGGGFHEGGRRRPLLWSLGSHTLSIFSFMQKNLFSLFQEPQALKIELTCSHLVKLFIHAKQNNFHFFRICGSPEKKYKFEGWSFSLLPMWQPCQVGHTFSAQSFMPEMFPILPLCHSRFSYKLMLRIL